MHFFALLCILLINLNITKRVCDYECKIDIDFASGAVKTIQTMPGQNKLCGRTTHENNRVWYIGAGNELTFWLLL